MDEPEVAEALTLKKRRSWLSRHLRMLLILNTIWIAALLAVAHVFLRPYPPPTLSEEATVSTGPLLPDGTVDYAAAFDAVHSEGVTPGNNAVVLLIEALGPGALTGEGRDRALERLGLGHLKGSTELLLPRLQDVVGEYVGMNPAPEEEALPEGDPIPEDLFQIPEFTGTGTYGPIHISPEALNALKRAAPGLERRKLRGRRSALILESLTHAPWKRDRHPYIAQVLDEHEETLNLVVEASQRPRWYVPLISNEGVLASSVDLRLHPIQMLSARAMMRLGDGQVPEALEDFVALVRLGRLQLQDRSLIGLLKAIAQERFGVEGMVKVLHQHPEMVQSVMKALSAEGPPPGREELLRALMEYERALCLCMASKGRFLFKKLPVDMNAVYSRINESFFLMRDAFAAGSFADIQMSLEAARSAVLSGAGLQFKGRWSTLALAAKLIAFHSARIATLADMTVTVGMPPMEPAHKRMVELSTLHRTLEVALVAQDFRNREGRWPEADELACLFKDGMPLDPFDDQALRYAHTESGVTIYSIGPNLTNDGGAVDEGSDIGVSLIDH